MYDKKVTEISAQENLYWHEVPDLKMKMTYDRFR